jgi:hypothetical protein
MRLLLAALFALWSCVAVAAQPAAPAPTTIAVSGMVEHPQALTLAMLEELPKQTVSVSYVTGRGEQKGTFTGAHLWDVLKMVAVKDEGRNSQLKRVIWLEGSDGYSVALTYSELDPDYGNHDFLIAYKREDGAMNGFRVVVPSDKHGGRYVSELAKIEVK